VNLEGVKRIMALEAELAEAKAALSSLNDEARDSVEQTHRQYRRDLVPVKNAIALFASARKRERGSP
jgi:MerR family transcriptional regulator/heat shock protein HspR